MSERTVYLRYFQPLRLSQRTAHERLTRICFIDYDREMALVVEHKNEDGNPEIIAIGRLSRLRGKDEAEMAVLVDDRFQHQGLGTELYRRLIEVARDEHVTSVVSTILSENREMQAICRKLGFRLESSLEDGTVEAVLKLYSDAQLAEDATQGLPRIQSASVTPPSSLSRIISKPGARTPAGERTFREASVSYPNRSAIDGHASQPRCREAASTGRDRRQRAMRRDPTQDYAVYLPSRYSATKAWPIIYTFDPTRIRQSSRHALQRHRREIRIHHRRFQPVAKLSE